MRAALVVLVALSVLTAAPAEAAKKKPQSRTACLKAAKKRKSAKARRAAVRRCPKAKPRATTKKPAAAPLPPSAAPAYSPAVAFAPEETVPAAPAPSAAPPLLAPAPVTKPDCGTSPWVGYTAADVDGVFKLTGKRTCVPGPTVSFQLRNTDAQEHNLYAEGIAPAAARRAIVATVAPDQTVEATTTLSAGEWRLFCSIEGHETMSRALTVTG
jgi:plastocyanin